MHVILINAASRRTEHDFDTIEEACGACGPKMPLICDGKAGYFEFVNTTSTEVRFVETDEDFVQFRYAHLPPALQSVSKRFYDLAEYLVLEVPRGRQRSVALLDLLRAKDAAVRAAMAR
jgi:hypothetical protein